MQSRDLDSGKLLNDLTHVNDIDELGARNWYDENNLNYLLMLIKQYQQKVKAQYANLMQTYANKSREINTYLPSL